MVTKTDIADADKRIERLRKSELTRFEMAELAGASGHLKDARAALNERDEAAAQNSFARAERIIRSIPE